MTARIRYVTKQGMLDIHTLVLERDGGLAGVRSQKALDACEKQSQQQFSGQELYPGLWTKAAAYAYFICKNHPFIDGNKRTAAATMEVFLAANGYELHLKRGGELNNAIRALVENKRKLEELAAWIKARSHLVDTL